MKSPVIKSLTTIIVIVLFSSVGYAKFPAHNPNFIRQLASPATYIFNKNLNTESICGTNNLQHVAEYDGSRGQPVEFVSQYEQSVGALAYGELPNTSKYCSGILISDDLFLTAAHCIDSSILKEFAVFNFQKLRGTADLAKAEHFKIAEVVEKGLNSLDFAIIRIEGKPGLKYGFQKINIAAVQNGNVLTIIQHPSGKPKMVDIGHKNGLRDQQYMTYGDLDTEPGSSGSAVLDQDGYIVGVHTNGGCFTSGGENAGVMMTEIAKVSKVVQELVQ